MPPKARARRSSEAAVGGRPLTVAGNPVDRSAATVPCPLRPRPLGSIGRKKKKRKRKRKRKMKRIAGAFGVSGRRPSRRLDSTRNVTESREEPARSSTPPMWSDSAALCRVASRLRARRAGVRGRKGVSVAEKGISFRKLGDRAIGKLCKNFCKNLRRNSKNHQPHAYVRLAQKLRSSSAR